MRHSQSEAGFTLVELLIVVLIIGILATIAIPVFNGQRVKARNATAQASVRVALSAAAVLAVKDQEDSYDGLTSADVALEDRSLSAGTGTIATPGPSANPQRVWVYAISSTGAVDTTTQTGSRNGVILCTVAKGDRIFCIRSLVRSVGSLRAGATYGSGADLEAATGTWGNNW